MLFSIFKGHFLKATSVGLKPCNQHLELLITKVAWIRKFEFLWPSNQPDAVGVAYASFEILVAHAPNWWVTGPNSFFWIERNLEALVAQLESRRMKAFQQERRDLVSEHSLESLMPQGNTLIDTHR
jgi:hypothetical protein